MYVSGGVLLANTQCRHSPAGFERAKVRLRLCRRLRDGGGLVRARRVETDMRYERGGERWLLNQTRVSQLALRGEAFLLRETV